MESEMKAVLMQMRCDKVLYDSWPVDLVPSEKDWIKRSSIFLHLSENVIRTISETKTVGELWTKLHAQYITTTVPNSIC